jgi:hypothetical protein
MNDDKYASSLLSFVKSVKCRQDYKAGYGATYLPYLWATIRDNNSVCNQLPMFYNQ